MLWTKRFKQDSEYQTYIQGDDVIKPNVSVCETEHHVHYNPGPPIDKPDRNRYGVIEIGNIEPFSYEGGVETGIALTTNSTNTWALTQKSSWLNVSPNRGTGSTTLTVEADEYDNTEEDREGFFTVRYTMPDARYSTTKYGIIQTKAPIDSSTISTMKILSAGTIVWKTTSTANTKTIEYSKDNGQTWSAITSNTGASAPTISVSEGETLQFRGNNDTYGGNGYNTFSGSTAVFSVKGNIMSMINSTDYSGITELVSGYTFYSLFAFCTGLTDVSQLILPATSLTPYCYADMFIGCTSLTNAPELLPATNLSSAQGCYSGMFRGCYRLTTAPALPATTMAQSACTNMFYECTSLTTAPELPATTLGMGCYYGMFYGCRRLTKAPDLPATVLANNCYHQMFADCESLTETCKFSATTMAQSACTFMFAGCTGLTTAYEIPVSAVSRFCYYGMFQGCTSLVNAPALPATTLANDCYHQMFSACTSLVNAPALPATTMAYGCYYGMFSACYSIASLPSNYLPSTALADYCYSNMFEMCRNLTNMPDLPATDVNTFAYSNMFQGCWKLSSLTSQLPITTVRAYGCSSMFSHCRSITSIPSNFLSLTTSIGKGGYAGMFNSCTGLTDVSNFILPTNLGEHCYSAMFADCASLTKAPILPSTILFQSCYYQMFRGCTNLRTAPELPAKYVPASAYTQMFSACTNLNYIKCLATDTGATACTRNWVSGVSATGIFVKANSMNDWTRGVNGVPSGWTIVDEKDVNQKQYLTFVALEDGTFSNSNTLSYSLDNGTTWTSLPSNTNTPTVNAGKSIMWKGAMTTGYAAKFTSSGRFNVEGNIMSILYNDNFSAQTELTTDKLNFTFDTLFMNSKVFTARSLYLPATVLGTASYRAMFQECTNLTAAPLLPATNLSAQTYYGMFRGCTSLYELPVISATQLGSECCRYMFYGCTSLTATTELPATTLANTCYENMFARCTNLKNILVLPATTLATSCYAYMFSGCTSLSATSTNMLPATTLANHCYQQMFAYCYNLKKVPKLPATTLAQSCYYEMFKGCINLVNAPALPATTLVSNCYTQMFQGCTRLNYIKCLATDISAHECTTGWVYNVASTGTFIKAEGMNDWLIDSINGIPIGWTVQEQSPLLEQPMTFEVLTDGIIGFEHTQGSTTGGWKKEIFYSRDSGQTWTSIGNNTNNQLNRINVTTGDKILFKGDNVKYADNDVRFMQFTTYSGATFNISGNIMCLINSSSYSEPEVSGFTASGAFWHLFYNCNGLIDASNLFLPANKLSYFCYEQMFQGCHYLTKAPSILPSTTLSQSCYKEMFRGCTSLTTAPDLPTTTLANYCYQGMFINCTSLTNAPELPATTLASSCYNEMFSGCTNLNYIKCLATNISASNCTDNWVSGVQTTSGRFIKDASMTGWTTGSSGIPSNWTVEDAT